MKIEPTSKFTKYSPILFWICLGVWLLIIYSPSLSGGFLWDDDVLLTQNLAVQDPQGLITIWTSKEAELDYWPVTQSVFWLLYQIFGLDSVGYRLVNLVLHLGNAFLFYLVLKRIQFSAPRWAAMMFALHPIQVDTVAWISEFKNTVSTAFLLGSFLAYCASNSNFSFTHKLPEMRQTAKFYWLSLGLFLLALLAKSSTCVLPGLLILLHFSFEKLIPKVSWQRLAPFFGVSAVYITLFIFFEKQRQSIMHFEVNFSLSQRILLIADNIFFYFKQFFLPYPLMVIYPQGNLQFDSISQVLSLVFLVTLCSGMAWLWFRKHHLTLTVLMVILICLSPISGAVNYFMMFASYTTDHFSYLASMGFCLLCVSGTKTLFQIFHPGMRPQSHPKMAKDPLKKNSLQSSPPLQKYLTGWEKFMLVVLMIFSGLTYQYSTTYYDNYSQWSHAVKHNPSSFFAQSFLGQIYKDQGDLKNSLIHINNSIALKPYFAFNYLIRADVYAAQKKYQQALDNYQQAVMLKADFYQALANQGVVYAALQKPELALAAYNQAIAINPHFANAYFNRANTYRVLQNFSQAKQDYEQVIRLRPNFAGAWHGLGDLYARENQPELALQNYDETLRLDPKLWATYINRGNLKYGQMRYQEALEDFNRALEINPQSIRALTNRGNVYYALKSYPEAVLNYSKAIELDGNFKDALANRGQTFLELHQPQKACSDFARLCQLGDCGLLDQQKTTGHCH